MYWEQVTKEVTEGQGMTHLTERMAVEGGYLYYRMDADPENGTLASAMVFVPITMEVMTGE